MTCEALSDKLSPVVQEVLRRRILLSDGDGSPLESPEEMFWRVAWEIAKAERRYARSAGVRETAVSFFQMMQTLDFLPNSPTLVNAGLSQGQLSACFVLPIEDFMESIFGTLRDMALIQKTGGGTASISDTGSVQNVKEIPESIRRVFVTVHDIEPEWHVRMQAAFQQHVENAVSKTVNLRRTATRNDIEKTFLLAHEVGCKGITVFHDGCRGEQVMRPGELKQTAPIGVQPCPESGGTMVEASGCISCSSCGYAFCAM